VRYLDRLQPLALLVLRITLGVILVAHGYPKVFGGGFHNHAEFVGKIGLPQWMAYFSTGAEFFGGIALIVGVFTRFFSFAVLIEMLVIIVKVEWKHGLKGGYEFPLALAAMAFFLIFFGAGPMSLDAVRGSAGGSPRNGRSKLR
jgi:putative oxidoreductase